MSTYRWIPYIYLNRKSNAGFHAQRYKNFVRSSICNESNWKINHTVLLCTTPHHSTQHNRRKNTFTHTHTVFVHFQKQTYIGVRIKNGMGWQKWICQENGKLWIKDGENGGKNPPCYDSMWSRKRDPQQSSKCTVTLEVIMRTFYMCLSTNSDKMLFTSRCDLMLPECEE